MKKLTREEKVKRLCRMDRIELAIGKLIMNLIGGIIGAGVILGVFWLIGMFCNWIEQSTFRFIVFITLGMIFTIKWINAEMSLQEPKAKRYK